MMFLFQPALVIRAMLWSSPPQLITLPVSSLTSQWSWPCGLAHTKLVTLPDTVMTLLPSYEIAVPCCANAALAASSHAPTSKDANAVFMNHLHGKIYHFCQQHDQEFRA